MNILFLSNPARNYYKFFNSLAEKFQKDGHKIFFAVDCTYSLYTNKIDTLNSIVYNFEPFFSSHTTDQNILKEYSNQNLNSMLLADFERGQVFNFWKKKPRGYHEKLKSALLTFFTKIFESQSIDAVIFEDVAGAFSYFSFCVCKKKNIKYIGITSSRLPGRFSISSDPLLNHTPTQEKLNLIIQGKIKPEKKIVDWSAEYIKNIDNTEPDYMSLNGLDSLKLSSNSSWESKIRIWKYSIKYGFKNSIYAFGIGNPLKQRFVVMRRTFMRKFRAKKLHRYYSPPIDGERYLLYPLHYHPEASTSVLSGTYLNEYEVIRNIAFNLPEGIQLYVKDHRSAYGFPDLSFYDAITRLPNVRLIEPFAKTKQLIRNSLAIITLTSTVGYEALLLGKKVFLFGSVFYQFHPNVIRITDPSDLFRQLKTNLDKDSLVDSGYNLKFIQAYYLSTLPGVLNITGKDAEKTAQTLYPAIQKYIKETLAL